MRLPAFTAKQQQQEDARAFHERLWDCYLSGQEVILTAPLGSTAKRLQLKTSHNLRDFWGSRGYALKTKQIGSDRLQVWIAPLPSTLHLQKARKVD